MVGFGKHCDSGSVPARITGGFAAIPVGAIVRAWLTCQATPRGSADFRAWLALREMAARRCRLGQGRAPQFSPDELATLLGVSRRHAAGSAQRLQDAGLVVLSPSAITFPVDEAPPGQALADSIGEGRGDLAIPRRILRYLASGKKPAVIAVALGVLLRCLSRRRNGFDGRGRVKASWIARVFGVDLRRVKAARKELVALGWIAPEPSDQISENRWGRVYRIDLAWAPPEPVAGPVAAVADCHPSPPKKCRGLPPPDLHQDPLQEPERNQEPASGGGTGVEMEKTGKTGGTPSPVPLRPTPVPAPDPGASLSASLPPPRLADVRPEDLAQTGRLLELHREATARGLIGASEADRIKFVAAAEHARSVGRVNPCGLFARLVKRAWWHFATASEEDRASRRLREHLFGGRVASVPVAVGRRAAPALSEDARLVGEVRAAMGRAGYRGDPLPLLRAKDGSWTRPRWDAALLELGLSP